MPREPKCPPPGSRKPEPPPAPPAGMEQRLVAQLDAAIDELRIQDRMLVAAGVHTAGGWCRCDICEYRAARRRGKVGRD